MEFIWKGKNPNIKNSTLCNDYDNGGLKNVVFTKIESLQCSLIKRLFDNNSALSYSPVFRKKL